MSTGWMCLIAATVIALVHVAYPFIERYVHKMVALVREAWQHARWYEKVGIVIFCFGWLIPGPLDEILGAMLIAHIIRRARAAA